MLRKAASNTASSQDLEATGVRQAALLSAPPSLVSTTEIVLTVVTAAQGLVAVVILLFMGEEERLRSAVDWYRRVRRQAALPSGLGTSIPQGQLRLAKCVLLLSAFVVVMYVPVAGQCAFWTMEHAVPTCGAA